MRNVELIQASAYYGGHATGWIAMVDRQPSHFMGPTAKADVLRFIATIEDKNPLIGRRVTLRWQDNRCGLITAVLPGCNALVRVLFDGRDFTVAMVPSDLTLEGETTLVSTLM